MSYLDDDDGETILVGSSLELEQRLDEPIPSRSVRVGSASFPVEDSDSSMHTFDIKKSPVSLATWREHEAYTGKALRKLPLKSPTSNGPPAVSATRNLDSMPPPPPPPQSQPELPMNLEDAIKGALQGLDTHVGAFAGFLQDTSNTLRTAAENTREAEVSAIGGILEGFQGIFSEVGKVGKAMVEAFDAEAFARMPCVPQAVVEESNIQTLATEKRAVEESSNINVVPILRTADNVLASASPPVQAVEPSSSATRPAISSKDSFEQYDALRKLGTLFQNCEEAHPNSFAHARAGEPASYLEGTSEKAPNAPFAPFVPFAAYASLKDPWKISSEKRPDRDIGCQYCEMKKVCSISLEYFERPELL